MHFTGSGRLLRALRIGAPVVAIGLSSASATPAQAGLLGGLLGGVTNTVTTTVTNTTTTVVPAATGVLTGQSGLLGATQQLLCPPATSLSQLLNTPGLGELGVGTIGSGLASLTCSAGLLEYRFETTWDRPGGGSVTRSALAAVGVPTLLNVDDDIAPDLVGTITLTGNNTVGIRIERSVGETATLPVSIQAVLNDATKKTLGRKHLAFGYDARGDRAPGTFVLSTPVDTLLKPSGTYQLDVTQTARGNAIAVTAGLFDGTYAAPINPTEVRLAYGASPDTASITAKVGSDLSVTLGQNRSGPATLTGRVVADQRQDVFSAQVNNLPSSLGLTARTTGDVRATYTASARVAAIRASLVSQNAGAITQKALLNLDDVPTGLTADLSGDTGTITTSGGPIGLTEIGFANGEPRLLTGEPAYVNADDDGVVRSTAVRIPGLERATFALGDAPTVSATIAATPLLARIKTPGRTISARVANLPHQFDLGLDLAAGRLSYDGHGSGIDRITLTGDGTEPLFGRATKLRGTLEGIPAVMRASIDTATAGAGGIKIEGGGAIGKVEVLASNGPETLPAGTGDGVVYRDLPGGDFVLAARVRELREVRFASGATTQLYAATKGGPFSLAVATATLTADGLVSDLPARATIGLNQSAGRLTFSGADASGAPKGIQALTLKARSTGGTLVGRADRIDARLEEIPAELTLDLAQQGQGVDVTASSGGIGLIELVAANRDPLPSDLPANGEQGATFTDRTGGAYVVAARVRHLKRISADLSAPVHLVTETDGGPFAVRVATDTLDASARVQDLPAKLDATLDLEHGKLTVHGRNADGDGQGIDLVTLDASSTTPLFGRARFVKARIEKIAPDLTLDLAQDNEGVKVTASDTIQTVEVAAASRPIDPATDLPADGRQGASYVDRPDTFLVAARINDLKTLDVKLTPSVRLDAETRGGPFDVRVDTADLQATGSLEDLPAKVSVGLDAAAGKLTFAGRKADDSPAGIDRVQLHVVGSAPLFGRARRVDLDVVKLAPTVTIDLASSGTGAEITADEPIESITLGATAAADPVDVDAVLDTPQGAVFRDTADEYVLAARLLDLEHVRLGLGGSDVGLSAKLRSTPFRALVRTPDLNADAFIDQLPHETDLTADLGGGRITFDGHGDGVSRLNVTARSSTPLFGRASTVSANIEDVPSKFAVALEGDGSRASVIAGDDGDAAVGKLELLVGDGDVAFPPALADPAVQGAVYHDRADQPFLIAARVLQLRKLVVDFSENLGLEAATAGGPFAVDVDTDAIGATANVADLPARAKLGLDLGSGQITFDGTDADGTPAGIDLLTLEARLTQPFLGEGNRVKARIEKLPAHVTLGFSQTDGAASLSADSPIQLLELQAWEDGKAEPALPADQGAILHDKAGQDFELAARIRQLKALRIDFGDAVSVHTETAGGLFTADVATDGLTAQATIDQLPTTLDLGLDLASGKVTYAGTGTVGLIRAAVQSDTPVFLGATKFGVTFRDVPTAFALTLGQDLDTSISLEADQPIGQIDVEASSPNRDAPQIPAGEAGALLDSTGGELGLALRVFDLQKLVVNTDPITLEATMRAGTPFRVDAKLAPTSDDPSVPVDPDAPPLHVQADILNLPGTFKVALGDINPAGSATTGGTKLTYQASSTVGRIHIKADGVALLEGADGIEADLAGVPTAFTMTLPEQVDGATPAQPLAQLAVNPGESIGELRLAAGSRTLPATAQADDVFSYNGDPAAFGVAVRLTAVKALSMNLDPVNLSLDQVAAATKPITLNASLPQDGGAPATITGSLNKPSGHTEVGVQLPIPAVGSTPAVPTKLLLRNGTAATPGTMGSLTLNITNLGSIPAASFGLSNIPRILDACLATDNTCRPADRVPAANSNYVQSTGFIKTFPDPSQNATAGGNNRPYASQVSMDFNDQGTSGNGTAISSMITVNASIDLGQGGAPVQIQNVRFHRLALDFGQPGSTFGYLGQTVPKLYLFIDSNDLPFVMNNIAYPPSITSFKIGTDSNTARANKRLVWLPGRKAVGAALDSRATGSLSCGGQQNLTSGGINLLDFPLVGQLVSVCG